MENTYYNYENNATTNPKKIKAIKAAARKNMLGNYSHIIGASLLIYIIISIVSSICSSMIMYNPGPLQYLIYYAAVFIITTLGTFFYTGVSVMHLHAARGKEINFSLLAFPVKNGSNRFLAVAFVISLLQFATSIPSTIMMYKAELMMYGSIETAVDAAFGVMILSIITIIISIVCLILTLALSLSIYLLIDNPDMSGKEAMASSFRYMKGNKMRLFLLELSFIGLCLLGILTFGLAYIWLIPYMEQSIAVFYQVIVQPAQSQQHDAQQPHTSDLNQDRPDSYDCY